MENHPLILVLQSLVHIYNELLKLALKKTGAVKENQLQTVEEIYLQEQKWIKQTLKVEENRQKAVDDVFKGKVKPSESPSVQECIDIIGDVKLSQEIQSIQEQLIEIIEQLKTQNELNQQLIRQSLSFVNMSLDIMRPQKNETNYGASGKHNPRQGQSKASMFDTQA